MNKAYPVVVVALLGSLVLHAFWKRSHPRVIRTHIGQALPAFYIVNGERAEQGRFDNSPLIYPGNDFSRETFTFIYDEAGAEIRLPEARRIWVNQAAGGVYDVTVFTSPVNDGAERFFDEMSALRGHLLAAGWTEAKPLASLADFRAAIERSEGKAPEWCGGQFRKETSEVWITLQIPSAGMYRDAARQKDFAAAVWFTDSEVAANQYKLLEGARLKVNGNVNLSLPLSYWVN